MRDSVSSAFGRFARSPAARSGSTRASSGLSELPDPRAPFPSAAFTLLSSAATAEPLAICASPVRSADSLSGRDPERYVAIVARVRAQPPGSRERAGQGNGRAPAPPRAAAELDYIERNREAWDKWASEHAARARTTWLDTELRWGLWNTPESELRLLGALDPRFDAIELGSGAAAISAWLARHGGRPVAVDISQEQLKIAERLQHETGVSFPLIPANAEEVPFDEESFDLAVSEYGASLWCNPRRWLPEAHRLLRSDGYLVFFTNGAMLMACTPVEGAEPQDQLVRPYFSPYRVEFPQEGTVEFHLTHGHWVRLLRATGFVLENLIEVRPPAGATPRFPFVSLDWARRWPSEEIWVARKTGPALDVLATSS
jgi:SAM-dependent methyltransferase